MSIPRWMDIKPRGRGRHYTAARGLVEAALRFAYRGGWPARLWRHVPPSTRVEMVPLELRILEPGSPPLKVAFASDLHLGPTTPHELLENAFEALAQARPDVLVLGGDYVFLDATAETAALLSSLVRKVPAPTKIGVLGNHDLWTAHDLLEAALKESGVEVLVNGSIVLPRPHDAIRIIGLDEPWTGHPEPERALRACAPRETKILVCHSPDGFLLVPSGISLYLAGHTHGGHIALPGGIPIVLPPGPGARRWPRGMHHFGDGVVYVSKGLGATELPIRTFARSEIVLMTLTAGDGTTGPVARRGQSA